MKLLDEYILNLYAIEELEKINEFDTEAIMKKLMPKSKGVSIVKKLIDASHERDAKAILSLSKKLGIKKPKQSTLDIIGQKTVDNYLEKKELSIRVLRNSLRAKPRVIEAAASTIAFASMIKQRGETADDNKRLKLLLKSVVEKGRSFYDEEPEDTKTRQDISSDFVVAWATISVTTVVLGSVLTFIYLFWPFIIGIIIGILILVTLGIVGKVL